MWFKWTTEWEGQSLARHRNAQGLCQTRVRSRALIEQHFDLRAAENEAVGSSLDQPIGDGGVNRSAISSSDG